MRLLPGDPWLSRAPGSMAVVAVLARYYSHAITSAGLSSARMWIKLPRSIIEIDMPEDHKDSQPKFYKHAPRFSQEIVRGGLANIPTAGMSKA